jgi:hypothetical protein
MRDRQGIGGEIVDHSETFDLQIAPQFGNGERPRVIGELHRIPRYRRCHRDRSSAEWFRDFFRGQIGFDCFAKRRVIIDRNNADALSLSILLVNREASIGSSDISE